jgi:hypothetical protein
MTWAAVRSVLMAARRWEQQLKRQGRHRQQDRQRQPGRHRQPSNLCGAATKGGVGSPGDEVAEIGVDGWLKDGGLGGELLKTAVLVMRTYMAGMTSVWRA